MHTVGAGNEGGRQSIGSDLLRVVLATALVLLAPLLAMRWTREVAWSGGDFALAAILLIGAGLVCVRAARHAAGWRRWQRLALVAALGLAFAAVWVELAVGVFFNLGS